MATPANFVTRAQWGSTFNYSSNTRMPTSGVSGVALHWEGSPMGAFTHDQCDNHLRSIEKYHVVNKGWAGIAYNAVVCPHGYIFEGRGTRYRSAANGDVGPNNHWYAVCYLGGKGDPFTEDAKPAYIRAVQWLRADGDAGSKVVGHRDLFSTECPGATIETWLKATNFSSGTTTPPPAAPVWGQPDTWKLGGVSADVTRLGERLVIHAKALGLPAPYFSGPGPTFTEVDVAAVAAFQKAQGWAGSDADGYPGAQTFALLAADPDVQDPVPPATKVTGLHWNIAGSDVNNGYKAENGTRGPAVARHALDIGFEVLLTCEAGQNDLRAGMNTVIGSLAPWEQRAKGIWHKPTITKTAPRKAYPDTIYAYLSTLKWGAAIYGIKDGKKFAFLEIHTDYRAPAKQARQVQSIFKKFRADCDAMGIKHANQVVCGDFNWDGTSGDDPFHALDGWNFEEKGSRTQATFLTGKHLDGVLAHKDANVTVTRPDRANTAGVRLSDHFPLKFTIELS